MQDPPLTTVHRSDPVYVANNPEGPPWLTVSDNTITTPDGIRRTHHAVILNPVAIVAVVDEHGRALLLRRHRWIVDRIGFEAPGGIIGLGEEPVAAARRELREETGFVCGEMQPIGELEPMPGLIESSHHIYLGHDPRQVGAPDDAEEAAQLLWVPVTETPDLLAAGQILGCGTAVALLAALSSYGLRRTSDSPGQQPVASPQTN
ncbi:NUDIX hydrolase (plasmid) [Nocardia sp. NBC_01377]|uniref:NUDIX hydrolase n=1 Tax=Nocardia sp. NBC_01377 TaxID=2903595 RepID=UPI002F912772